MMKFTAARNVAAISPRSTEPTRASHLPWLRIAKFFPSLVGVLLTACVFIPPRITSQPVSVSIEEGGDATFTVTATGTELTYQWQRSTDNAATWSDVTGATQSAYTIVSVNLSLSGNQYRVVVSAQRGTATSDAATLTVIPKAPAFSELSSTLTGVRVTHTATLLNDGRVLITGGFSSTVFPAPALNTAELYDPATNTFTAVPNTMQQARNNHTATLLPDGQVLLAGGQYDNDDDGHNTAELYDPTTQTFTALSAVMTTPRGGHAAAPLLDGRVLIVGGFFDDSAALDSAELYDPVTRTFTALSATMVSHREEFTATLLPSGEVLLTGGTASHIDSNTAELYDPTTQTFSVVAGTMTVPRGGQAATLLPDGSVLLTGGSLMLSPSNPASSTVYDSAEVYDPLTQSFSAIPATMTSPRGYHTATLLPNGTVLLTGGTKVDFASNSLVFLDTAEVYLP